MTMTRPFPQPPSRLEPDAMAELESWAEIDPDADENDMARAGTTRNVLRHAEAWGPHLVALLSARGRLKPGADPLVALEDLIELAAAAPKTKRYAVCLLLRRWEDGRVLAIDRVKKSGIPRDMGLPGGKVKPGETLLAALAREVEEETGKKVVGQPRMVFVRFDGEFETYTYVVDCEGELRSSPEGEVEWVRIEELIADHCTFKGYNRELFAELGIQVSC